MPNGLFYSKKKSLDQFISVLGVSGWCFLLQCLKEIPICNAYSVDPDQMLHSVGSDLGLHCLLMYLLWDARHKWVNLCPAE